MVEYLKSTLFNEGLQSWIHTASSYLPPLPHLPGLYNPWPQTERGGGSGSQRSSREREMSEVGERGRESPWSSEDGRSHDLSLTDDVEENYFSCPIVSFGRIRWYPVIFAICNIVDFPLQDDSLLQTPDEIEEAIDKIKSLVLETEGITQERRALVQRLISLRLRLQDVREVQEERGDAPEEEFRIVSQHHFLIQKQIVHRTAQYCDKCSGIIWTVIQNWYRCKGEFCSDTFSEKRRHKIRLCKNFSLRLPVPRQMPEQCCAEMCDSVCEHWGRVHSSDMSRGGTSGPELSVLWMQIEIYLE